MTRRQVVVALITAAVALVLLSLGTLWDGPLPVRKMGSLGEWLSGLGAGAAVLAAVWTVRAEADQRRQDERNRREADARSVILGDPWLGQSTRYGYNFKCSIANYAARPVRVVRVQFEWNDPTSVLILDGDDGIPAEDTHTETLVGWLAPGETLKREVVERFKPAPGQRDLRLERDVRTLSVRFVDVYGDEWQVSYGPRGSESEATRLTNSSGFW